MLRCAFAFAFLLRPYLLARVCTWLTCTGAAPAHPRRRFSRALAFVLTLPRLSCIRWPAAQVRAIGSNGFELLCSISREFDRFDHLFAAEVELGSRELLSAQQNAILDNQLQSFFRHLSPVFQLPAAHKALEWLVRRFQVHAYNVDEIMRFVLFTSPLWPAPPPSLPPLFRVEKGFPSLSTHPPKADSPMMTTTMLMLNGGSQPRAVLSNGSIELRAVHPHILHPPPSPALPLGWS